MTMKRILLLFLLFCGGYVHAQELDSARIHYRQGHRNVDVLFRDNRTELERFIRILREEHGTGRLENVVIRSWASPDGANRLNEVLSKRRADSLKAYLVRHAGIPDSIVSMHGEGIAWDMLRRMVAASDMLYKKEVLHILDHTPVWVFDESGRVVDGRKKQLMELRGGRPYVYMQENFFPDLRSSLSVACYRKSESPVTISRKEAEVKEPEPALQPDSVAETTSEPATVRQAPAKTDGAAAGRQDQPALRRDTDALARSRIPHCRPLDGEPRRRDSVVEERWQAQVLPSGHDQPGGTLVVRAEARQPVARPLPRRVRGLHVVRPRKRQGGLSGRGRNGGCQLRLHVPHRTAVLLRGRYRGGLHAQQVRGIPSHRRTLRVPADKPDELLRPVETEVCPRVAVVGYR